MADEFQLGSGNWWDTSRNRFENGTSVQAPISTTLNSIASFGGTNMVLQGGNNEQSGGGSGGGILGNPNLQMMGLGLSSQGMDWNQALLRGEKAESSFHSLLQEDISSNTNTFQHKIYNSGASSDDNSSANEFKQINRGFSLDQQPQFASQATSNDSTITSQNNLKPGGYNNQLDSPSAYGLLLSENQPTYENRPMNYAVYPASSSYGGNPSDWNKFPQFLRSSPPKQAAAPLHFTNNTPFWNASAPVNERSGFFPTLQNPIPVAPSFDEKPKMTSEMRDMGRTAKKNSSEMSSKRPRNETPSPLPAFKVRKEKMGDRITALQQLVSPFGKTDTASVLSEAIEYIKFLHEQVSVLSTPYMKNGAPIQQHHQNSDKSNMDPEGPRPDLRSRGLCLVPVSSTFPVTHETTVDFWTPTFGGTFR